MDVLTDVLNVLELKGWLSSRRELVSPWRYDFAHSPDSVFHVVTAGRAYLQVGEEAAPIYLRGGDVVLFPTGQAHALCDDPLSPLTRSVQLDYSPERRHHIVNLPNESAKLLLLCGAFHFERPANFPLLNSLPPLIHIPGADGQVEPALAAIVDLIARESAVARSGTEVVLRRLTELLFIQVIRLWVELQAEKDAGWSRALSDQAVGAALGFIHGAPAHPWTVNELASRVSLSRSAFSARFSTLVGEPPLTYLTRWRMVQATRMLKNEVGVATIAESLGYASEVAFRKAFKREIGIPPATYRRQMQRKQ